MPDKPRKKEYHPPVIKEVGGVFEQAMGLSCAVGTVFSDCPGGPGFGRTCPGGPAPTQGCPGGRTDTATICQAGGGTFSAASCRGGPGAA
jgi:hypothetical protein